MAAPAGVRMFLATWSSILCRRPLPVASFSYGVALAGAKCRARASVRNKIDPTLPISDRVAAPEANFKHVDEAIGQAFAEIDTCTADLESKIQSESDERKRSDQAMEVRSNEAFTGNMSALLFGAFWIFIGIIISSWAPEIAKIVAGQWSSVYKAM
jgi:hypothetical protein